MPEGKSLWKTANTKNIFKLVFFQRIKINLIFYMLDAIIILSASNSNRRVQ